MSDASSGDQREAFRLARDEMRTAEAEYRGWLSVAEETVEEELAEQRFCDALDRYMDALAALRGRAS